MKVFKKALAAVLAGFLAVGSLSVSAYTVKADEATANDAAFETVEEFDFLDDSNTFRTENVTKIQFVKDFKDNEITFLRQLKVSPATLAGDMDKAMKAGKGISWLGNVVVTLNTKGTVYTARYSDKDKAYVTTDKGLDVTKQTGVITFNKAKITIEGYDKGITLTDLLNLLGLVQAKTSLSGPYVYGGTQVQKVVANSDGTFSAKIDNQNYVFFVQNNTLYAQGDVTGYKAIKTWENRNIIMAIYVPESKIDVYRIYNPNSGEHFYTTNKKEAESAVKAGWNDEGRLCMAPKDSDYPVYRLFNPNARDAGSHHFTISPKEREDLVKAGWVDEGVAFYSAAQNKGTKLWRSYNKNDGGHNFTINIEEHKKVVAAGWTDEGLAWYVYPLS